MAFDRQSFFAPDRRYAIYPIYHQGIVGSAKNTDALLDAGFAGVVGNLPYTDDFPHNEQAWDETAQAYRTLIRSGLHTWIYDEKGYPSGTAGGAVIDENPDFIAEGLYCYEYWKTLTGPCSYRADVPGDHLVSALLLPLNGEDPVDVTDMQDARGTLRMQVPEGTYHLFMMSRRRLFDGTHAAESYSEPRNYICLSDREATKAYLRITYDNYARRLQDEFGRGVLAFFTDEPSLIAWNIRQAVYPIVPWHRTFPEKFMERFGYPISLAVAAVVTRRGREVVKRRCDFWDFVADTVADGYFGTIRDWCRAHGVKFSGHMLEEERLSAHVINYGSLYRSMSRMDWPGIDQLDSEPQYLMARDKLPIARLAASFADVNGEHECFTEFSDHTSRMENKQIGMDWIRASVNWHVAMGVNDFTSYYNFSAFSAEEIRALNEYTARLGYLMRQGRRDSRVALLYPEATVWAAYTPSVAERARDFSPETLRVENALRDLSWELLERQIDFDYVDEKLLQEGTVEGGCLKYGDREYRAVVLPAVTVLSEKTMARLEALLQAGASVIFAGGIPTVSRETGAECDFEMTMLRHRGAENFYLSGEPSLPGRAKIPALPRTVILEPSRLECVLTGAEGLAKIVDGEVISDSILSHLRVDGDTRVLFLTNMGGKPYEGTAALENVASAEIANAMDGSVATIPVEQAGGRGRVAVKLKPYESAGYILHS